MATIKRKSNGKIITKDGKVSCTCCEAGECCPYPANAFENGDFTIDDLPDTLFDELDVLSYNKLESPFDASSEVGVPYLIYYGGLGNGIGIRTGSGAWSIQIDASFGSENQCLLRKLPEEEPFDWVIDQFADTYTVSYEGDSATVTRQSLCIWTGETIDEEGTTVRWRLEYVSINDPDAQANYKWIASIQGLTTIAGIKIPPQNSPVGTYGLAGITVS